MHPDNPLADPEVAGRVIQQCLELFFNPEIQRRQENENLEIPFALCAAQIVFSPGGGSVVRLNDEVRFGLDATLIDGKRTMGDANYNIGDIAEVHEFRLTAADKDCGHATLFRTHSGWSLCFDFRRNQDTCLLYSRTAREFLESAKAARNSERWRVFVDNLFSACELAAKASLLWFADDQFRDKTNHKAVSARFNRYARSGNVPDDARDVFNLLRTSRSTARYITGECKLDPAEADRWIEAVEKLITSP
jgi:uncharacterized protein (UPF0332 family)